MKQRRLGGMGMSESYGPGEEAESIATIHRALELGINFFDTAAKLRNSTFHLWPILLANI